MSRGRAMRMPPDQEIHRHIWRQIRRLRRRRNVYEVARAVSLLVVVAAGAATAIVLLALRAGPRLFAAGAWTVAAAAGIGGAALLAGTHRRWLGRERAPRWIDGRAGLEGRLTTLVDLDRRGAGPADAFFLPLLLEENRRRLSGWRPVTLVPRRVPWRAVVSAIGATAALLLALALAPALAPPVPAVFYADAVPEGAGERAAIPGRVMMAPARDRGEVLQPMPSRSLTAELQDRIRRRLWGADPDATRAALARMTAGDRARDGGDEHRAGRAGNDTRDEDVGRRDDAAQTWEVARRDPAARAGSGPATEPGERSSGDAARAAAERRVAPDTAAASGDTARGAGTATDPRLLGPATDPGRGRDTFDLPIVARVRSLGAGSRPPAGEGPPAATDARPDLGAGQRRDAPVARMTVPAAYEDLVRRVYAHRIPERAP